jgi:hypothetical protein
LIEIARWNVSINKLLPTPASRNLLPLKQKLILVRRQRQACPLAASLEIDNMLQPIISVMLAVPDILNQM